MVTVRLFAAAREAVGAAHVEVPEGPVDEVCAAVAALAPAASGGRASAVLAISTLLCDGVRYRSTDRDAIPAGSVVDVLPPFAGG